jgi:protein MpaA
MCVAKVSIKNPKRSLAVALVFLSSPVFCQGLRVTDQISRSGFISIPAVVRENFQDFVLPQGSEPGLIKSFCEQVAATYQIYKWNPAEEGCGNKGVPWRGLLKSHSGSPLIYAEFGSGQSTTLILGGVHPDELTPIPLVFKFANHLQSKPELIPQGSRVIVAPLVNPDGFFRKGATRTNGRGIDVNRNFFTQDWYATAKTWWAERRQKNERHFPGHIPNSEIETLFQIWLIDTFKPDKIISIHAPLGFYDYDGPGDQKPRALTSSEEKAKALVQNMSASSRNYKIVDYSFYPGSLGNYAGNERGIPTVTLELETTNPDKTALYWTQFSPGLEQAVRYPFVNPGAPRTKGASLFLESYGRKTAQFSDGAVPNPKL